MSLKAVQFPDGLRVIDESYESSLKYPGQPRDRRGRFASGRMGGGMGGKYDGGSRDKVKRRVQEMAEQGMEPGEIAASVMDSEEGRGFLSERHQESGLSEQDLDDMGEEIRGEFEFEEMENSVLEMMEEIQGTQRQPETLENIESTLSEGFGPLDDGRYRTTSGGFSTRDPKQTRDRFKQRVGWSIDDGMDDPYEVVGSVFNETIAQQRLADIMVEGQYTKEDFENVSEDIAGEMEYEILENETLAIIEEIREERKKRGS